MMWSLYKKVLGTIFCSMLCGAWCELTAMDARHTAHQLVDLYALSHGSRLVGQMRLNAIPLVEENERVMKADRDSYVAGLVKEAKLGVQKQDISLAKHLLINGGSLVDPALASMVQSAIVQAKYSRNPGPLCDLLDTVCTKKGYTYNAEERKDRLLFPDGLQMEECAQLRLETAGDYVVAGKPCASYDAFANFEKDELQERAYSAFDFLLKEHRGFGDLKLRIAQGDLRSAYLFGALGLFKDRFTELCSAHIHPSTDEAFADLDPRTEVIMRKNEKTCLEAVAFEKARFGRYLDKHDKTFYENLLVSAARKDASGRADSIAVEDQATACALLGCHALLEGDYAQAADYVVRAADAGHPWGKQLREGMFVTLVDVARRNIRNAYVEKAREHVGLARRFLTYVPDGDDADQARIDYYALALHPLMRADYGADIGHLAKESCAIIQGVASIIDEVALAFCASHADESVRDFALHLFCARAEQREPCEALVGHALSILDGVREKHDTPGFRAACCVLTNVKTPDVRLSCSLVKHFAQQQSVPELLAWLARAEDAFEQDPCDEKGALLVASGAYAAVQDLAKKNQDVAYNLGLVHARRACKGKGILLEKGARAELECGIGMMEKAAQSGKVDAAGAQSQLPDFYVQLGDLYEKESMFDNAFAWYAKAKNVAGNRACALIYLNGKSKKSPDNARKEGLKLIKEYVQVRYALPETLLDPADSTLLLRVGDDCYHGNPMLEGAVGKTNYAMAVDCFTPLVRSAPTNDIIFKLGTMFMQGDGSLRRDKDKARYYFSQLSTADAHYELARLAYSEHNYSESLQQVNKTIELHDTSNAKMASACLLTGIIALKSEGPHAAVAKELLERVAVFMPVTCNYATLYGILGKELMADARIAAKECSTLAYIVGKTLLDRDSFGQELTDAEKNDAFKLLEYASKAGNRKACLCIASWGLAHNALGGLAQAGCIDDVFAVARQAEDTQAQEMAFTFLRDSARASRLAVDFCRLLVAHDRNPRIETEIVDELASFFLDNYEVNVGDGGGYDCLDILTRAPIVHGVLMNKARDGNTYAQWLLANVYATYCFTHKGDVQEIIGLAYKGLEFATMAFKSGVVREYFIEKIQSCIGFCHLAAGEHVAGIEHLVLAAPGDPSADCHVMHFKLEQKVAQKKALLVKKPRESASKEEKDAYKREVRAIDTEIREYLTRLRSYGDILPAVRALCLYYQAVEDDASVRIYIKKSAALGDIEPQLVLDRLGRGSTRSYLGRSFVKASGGLKAGKSLCGAIAEKIHEQAKSPELLVRLSAACIGLERFSWCTQAVGILSESTREIDSLLSHVGNDDKKQKATVFIQVISKTLEQNPAFYELFKMNFYNHLSEETKRKLVL